MSPNAGGGGVAWSEPMSTAVLYTGAQIKSLELTPYLTCALLIVYLVTNYYTTIKRHWFGESQFLYTASNIKKIKL
jgi:hypothetical protein